MIPNLPVEAEYINTYNAAYKPSTVHAHDTMLAGYFRKYFLQRAMSVFTFENLPATWSRNLFLYTLFCCGYVGVFNTDKFGVVANPAGLRGYDVNYQPTNLVIANPLLRGIREPRIGVECEVIKLQPNFSGVMDIVNLYADLAAMCVESMRTNLVNSKIAYFAEAQDKAAAEQFKKSYDQVQEGNPFVVTRPKAGAADLGKNAGLSLFFQNVGQNYISNDLHLTLRKLEQDFDRWVGIPTANTEKRERLTDDEVNIGGIETRACVDLWFDTLVETIAKTNTMFGLNIAVKFRYDREEVPENGDIVDFGLV